MVDDTFNWWQAPLIALLIAIVGMLGNLVMAAIKRDRGINSWGVYTVWQLWEHAR